MADNLDTYVLEKTGEVIFTSHFLSKRGRCCKSTCLHCPYGLTLSKIKLEFHDYDQNLSADYEKTLLDNEYNQPVSIADQLLSQNLGNSKRKTFDLSSIRQEDFKSFSLKGYYVGFMQIKDGVVLDFFLSKQFQFQNLTLETIQDHFDSWNN